MKLFVFCVLLVAGISVLTWLLENREFKKQIEEQSLSAEMLINESNARFNDATLARELGQAISRSLDIDNLLKTVMHILKSRLDFERGSVFLANEQMTRLIYKAGYGINQEQEAYLRNVQLHLDKPGSKGPIVVSFKERKPFFIDNSDSIYSELSQRSKELLHLSKSNSFICVPIVFKDEPLGVLAVDREKSTVPLKQKDLDLLMVIAPQIAISINNIRMFEKMQSSEEKYRVLVESANSIIMRLDTQGRITFLNKYGQEFYGYSEKEILGKNALGLILPNIDSSGKDFSAIFSDFLAHPERHENFENENIRRNREKVWVSWSNKAICDRDGSLAEILCVGNDITERKKAEQEKKSLELQLVRSQKMEAIGTLAGGVAHDLNNILSGIVSYPEILLMEVQDDSPMRKSLEVIKRSGEKAAAIVQDLLTLARRGVSVSNVVNLNSIIEEYFKSPEYSKLVQYHPLVTFDFHLEDELSNVLGSSVHLSKTLMNLVSNAAEAMPKGGTITVSTKNKSVEQAINGYDVIGKGEYVVMSVADSGIGISPEDVKRIFEPFYSKKEMGRSGTGLGMAVIWSTVKDHQGYIDVKTEVGSGTQFDLYFPVTGMEMKAQDLKQPIQAYKGTEKILVVDDVAEQREIAKEFLGKLGYQVDVACSGEEALAYLKDRKADLVLLDMIMDPGMDGLATYEKILEMNERQKAIIVSGFSESDRVKQALSLGAGAYVKKPYVLHDIARSVREELDKGLR
ncbi:MAG TPA: response regulator [Deltaproteobacteria bacterium]|nr:response regulator [Deltaproteobacteria bacterium]